jgi:hypothetical protein
MVQKLNNNNSNLSVFNKIILFINSSVKLFYVVGFFVIGFFIYQFFFKKSDNSTLEYDTNLIQL